MFHLTLKIPTILNAAQEYIVVSIQPRAKPRAKPRIKPRIKPRAISREIFFQFFSEIFSKFFRKNVFYIYVFWKKKSKSFQNAILENSIRQHGDEECWTMKNYVFSASHTPNPNADITYV